MADLVVMQDAELDSLDSTVSNFFQGGSLGLFVSNHTPVDTDTLATYTAIEAAFGGYARKTVSDWGAAYTNGSGEGQVDAGIYTWTATGAGLPVTVYGVFFIGADGDLKWAHKFNTSGVTLTAAGDPFSYKPSYTRS